MATLLDATVLQAIASIFPFLFVLVLVYALLARTKLVGENTFVHIIIALAISLPFLFWDLPAKIISTMAPWFIIFFIFIIFALIVFKIMGAKDEQIATAVKMPIVYWSLIIVALVILTASVTKVYYGEYNASTVPEGEDSSRTIEYEGEDIYLIYHPKMLGFIFIFLVAAFTVGLMSKRGVVPGKK